MTIPPVVYREPERGAIPTSEFLIYRCFIEHLHSRTTPERAVLRAARDCGVSRRRVLEVVRSINADVLTSTP